MNPFTKEELETIIDAFNFIHGAPAWRTTEGWDDKLQEKIQLMIDNYCEHEWCTADSHYLGAKYHSPKCSKCGAIPHVNQ